MELIDSFRAGFGMQTIDILGQNGDMVALFLKISQRKMGFVGFGVKIHHRRPIEIVEQIGMFLPIAVRKHHLIRNAIFALHMVKSLRGTEIGDA